MSERQMFLVIGTATIGGPVQCRGWAMVLNQDALDQLAATLTEEYGEPSEWIFDDSGGRQVMVFLGREPE